MPLDPAYENPICRSCISKYRHKHPGHKWKIPCSGIITDVGEVYPEDQLADLSPADLLHLEYTLNPVKWAKERLGWDAYPYQEEELLCSSRRSVLRFGRQTGKTDVISVKILHAIALNPRGFNPIVKVLGAAPHESQIDNIYNRILELAEGDKTLWGRITSKKTPFSQIVCEGTGRVYLFCTGTASKKGASTIRGQPADEVYLDEADYLGKEDWSTILPIANSKPTNRMTISSTPVQQRGRLYRHCNDPGYRETHITIYDKPGVTEAQIEQAKDECETEMDWILEYLAEFGDAIQGVYKAESINRSLEDYELGNFDPELPLYIGVDWNKAAVGDWISIVADMGGKLRLVDMIQISAADRTHISAVDRIASLNARYPNVRGIYCDDGHGETQLELLWNRGRQAAPDHPDKRLLKLVVSVDFARQFEIFSQKTNKMRTTRTKPYMTNRSAMYVDEDLVRLPRVLDKKDLMVHQARNYSVIRRTPAGMPVYSEGNQHCLIAWQLSMFAYDQIDGTLSRQPAPRVPAVTMPSNRTPAKLESKRTGPDNPVGTIASRRAKAGRGRSGRGRAALRSRSIGAPKSRALNLQERS